MMSSAVKTGGAEFEFSAPNPLFKTRMLTWTTNFHEFDVTPDGQRFLMIRSDTAEAPSELRFVLNWAEQLRESGQRR